MSLKECNMNFITDFFKGIGNCFQAAGILFSRGLWPFLFFPLVIWILLWLLSFYGAFRFGAWLSELLLSYFSLDTLPAEGHWLSFAKDYLLDVLTFVLSLALKIFLWFIAGTFIKYVLLIFLSPVFSLLSEKTESRLTGREFEFSFSQLLTDIVRGIGISLRNLLLEYSFIFICFVLTLLFPPLIIVSAPLLLFIGWYYTGFTLLDYNFERHRLSARESNAIIASARGYACAVGMVYSVLLSLPFLFGGLIGIVFGPVIATIGGTICFLQIAARIGVPVAGRN